jgi:hypothetical protein
MERLADVLLNQEEMHGRFKRSVAHHISIESQISIKAASDCKLLLKKQTVSANKRLRTTWRLHGKVCRLVHLIGGLDLLCERFKR